MSRSYTASKLTGYRRVVIFALGGKFFVKLTSADQLAFSSHFIVWLEGGNKDVRHKCRKITCQTSV